MIAEKSGGPAFPVILGHNAIQQPVYAQGMTLRDYFAANALPGVISATMSDHCHNWKPADFAREAYEMADAMLAERAK